MSLVEISIYTQSAHVTKKFTKTLQSGLDAIQLPSTVVPESIVVLNEKKQIEAFTYRCPLTLQQRVQNSRVDKNLALAVHVTKDQSVWSGKLIDLTSDAVTLQDEEHDTLVIIHRPSTLTIVNEDKKSDVFTTTPSVMLKSNNSMVSTLSYLQLGVSWCANATVIIDTRTNTAMIRISGQIKNDCGLDLNGVISLVAGDVYQPSTPQIQLQAMSLATTTTHYKAKTTARSNASYSDVDAVGPQRMEEFVRFPIGKRHIAQHEIVELFTASASFVKIYKHVVGSHSNGTNYGYRFEAPQFLPSCQAQVYTSAPPLHVIERFLGECKMSEKQPKQRTTLMIGTSTVVKVRSHVEIIEKDSSYGTKQEIVTIEIENTSPALTACVSVKYHLPFSRVVEKTIENTPNNQVKPFVFEQKNGCLTWKCKNLQPVARVVLNYTVFYKETQKNFLS